MSINDKYHLGGNSKNTEYLFKNRELYFERRNIKRRTRTRVYWGYFINLQQFDYQNDAKN